MLFICQITQEAGELPVCRVHVVQIFYDEGASANNGEPLAVALHSVRTAHINLGDTAVVIGAGPIGQLVIQCLRLAGTRAVGVVEIVPGRAELAAQLGADALFTSGTEDLPARVSRTLGAEPDVVFDCAGGYEAPLDGDDWKRFPRRELPADPDAWQLFQEGGPIDHLFPEGYEPRCKPQGGLPVKGI